MAAGGGPEMGCPDVARPPPLCGWKRKGGAKGSDDRSPPTPPQQYEFFYPIVALSSDLVVSHLSASCCGSDCGGNDRGIQNEAAQDSAIETRTRCPMMAAKWSESGQRWAESGQGLVVPEVKTWSSLHFAELKLLSWPTTAVCYIFL